MNHLHHTRLKSLKKIFKSNKHLVVGIISILILSTGGVAFALTRNNADNQTSKVNTSDSSKSSSLANKDAADIDTVDSQPSSNEVNKDADNDQNETTSGVEADAKRETTKPSGDTSNASNSGKNTRQPRTDVAPPEPYTPVQPNPYCPAPNFNFSVQRETNSYNMRLAVSSSPAEPSNSAACGGGINYSYPTVSKPSNGPICDGAVYPIDNYNWGVSCSIYGNAQYGAYTFTFTTTGTNGYGFKTTRSVSHTINYQPQ